MWQEIQILFLVLLLLLTSIEDIRTRYVSDRFWQVGIILAFIFHIIIFIVEKWDWQQLLLNVLVAGLFIGIFILPKAFGQFPLLAEGDLLGITIIAVMFYENQVQNAYSMLPPIFGIMVNAIIIQFFLLFANLLQNLYSYRKLGEQRKQWFGEFDHPPTLQRKLILFLTAKRMPSSKIGKPGHQLMEEYIGEEDLASILPNLDRLIQELSPESQAKCQQLDKPSILQILECIENPEDAAKMISGLNSSPFENLIPSQLWTEPLFPHWFFLSNHNPNEEISPEQWQGIQAQLKKENQEQVWVSNTIPFLVFLLFGVISYYFWENILFRLFLLF